MSAIVGLSSAEVLTVLAEFQDPRRLIGNAPRSSIQPGVHATWTFRFRPQAVIGLPISFGDVEETAFGPSSRFVGTLKLLCEFQRFGAISFAEPERGEMRDWYRQRYLDLLGSIYIYNEHRGYTAIDRLLLAIRVRWPDDDGLIAAVEKHRADERKHYLMFRRWFERRGVMPLAVDRTCGHIDRFVGIMFGSTIDQLDPQAVIGRDDLFERMCRVISLTEQRGHRQVQVLLRHPSVRSDPQLMKIFRIIERDEPSHWAPYDQWLAAHGRRRPQWWERAIDRAIHSELLFVKLPILFLALRMKRLTRWPDQNDMLSPVSENIQALAA